MECFYIRSDGGNDSGDGDGGNDDGGDGSSFFRDSLFWKRMMLLVDEPGAPRSAQHISYISTKCYKRVEF